MDIHLFFHRVYKLLGQMHFFENDYGIKAYNRPPTFEPDIYINEGIIHLKPDEILMGFDGLTDEYTLCNQRVIDAPHYSFIKSILSGKIDSECEYLLRERKGYLDGRFSSSYSNKLIEDHTKQCYLCKKDVEEDNYPDVYVYTIGEKYYVLDGKHRVVMCHLLNKKVRCHVLDKSELRNDLYTYKLYQLISKKPSKYSVNKAHLEKIFDKTNNNQPRVLIINRNRTSNLGDQAIAYSMVNLFKKLGADVELSELCEAQGERRIKRIGKIKRSEKYIGVSYVVERALRKLIKLPILYDWKWNIKNKNVLMPIKEKQYDYILIGGGELIQSNRIFPVAIDKWITTAKKYQITAKIGLFSIGSTEKYSWWDSFHLKHALKQIDFAYVRDFNSKTYLSRFFKVSNAIQIADVVFTNYSNEHLHPCISHQDKILYGITACHRVTRYSIYAKSESEYYEKEAQRIKRIIEEREEKVYVFFMSQEDYDECVRFADYCKEMHGINIDIADTSSIQKTISCMSESVEIYSPRMHACILANVIGKIRVNPILISPKMKTYSEMYANKQDYKYYGEITEQGAKSIISFIDKCGSK